METLTGGCCRPTSRYLVLLVRTYYIVYGIVLVESVVRTLGESRERVEKVLWISKPIFIGGSHKVKLSKPTLWYQFASLPLLHTPYLLLTTYYLGMDYRYIIDPILIVIVTYGLCKTKSNFGTETKPSPPPMNAA